jgi:hypothetical protein
MYSNIYAPFLSTTFSQFLNISWYWSSGRRSNTKSKLDNSTNNLRKARHACCAACSLSVNVGLQCNFFPFQGRLCRRGGICESVILAPRHTGALNFKHSKKVFLKIQKIWKKIFTCRQWCILSSVQSIDLKYSVLYSTRKRKK